MKLKYSSLLGILEGEWKGILSLSSITVVRTFLLLLQSFFITKVVIDIFQKHQDFPGIFKFVLGFIVVFSLRTLLNNVLIKHSSSFGAKCRLQLQKKLIEGRIARGVNEESETTTNEFIDLISNGLNTLDSYFANYLPGLINATFSPLIVLLVIILIDWKSALYGLLTVPLMPIFGILIGKFTKIAIQRKWNSLQLLQNYFLDLISGIPTLQVFGRLENQEKRIEEYSNRFKKETMGVLRISFLSTFALELIANLSVALIALMLGLRLIAGNISLFSAFLILLLAPEIYWPIRQASTLFHSAAEGIDALNKVSYFLEIENYQDRGIYLAGNENSIDSIFWDDLKITRGNQELFFPAGNIKAGGIHNICAPSGSGKTTFTNVIMGFLKSNSGEIEIQVGGESILLNSLNLESRMKLFSWFPQNPRFPNESILKHFKRTCPKVTEVEITHMLNALGLDINEFPEGLNTFLGTTKSLFSVGELRRIALARTFLHSAPIIVLDEPTASLDYATAEKVNEIISSLSDQGKIIFNISHRLSFEKSLN